MPIFTSPKEMYHQFCVCVREGGKRPSLVNLVFSILELMVLVGESLLLSDIASNVSTLN